MVNFEWKILEIFKGEQAGLNVRFSLKATDDENFVETEGYHLLSDDVAYKSFEEIKEEDLIRWLEKDTTKDEANLIKSNLELQLQALKNSKKVEFPWLSNTFTIE